MAYKDTSGTIIIDAVITELGRKRLAQGDLKITKFALGDDEIDYRRFDGNPDVNHKQQTILSQSLFEATSEESGIINHGLIDIERQDLLYIPRIKLNNKLTGFAIPTGSFYYLSVNSETSKKLKSTFGSTDYFLETNSVSKTKLVFESGIENNINRDQKNRESLILNTGLLDSYFNIYCDSRFVENVLTAPQNSVFKNEINGLPKVRFGPLKRAVPVSLSAVVDKYNAYLIESIPNHIFQYNNARDDRTISAFDGPRGTAGAINLKLLPELLGDSSSTRNQKYIIFGKIDQILFGGSDKYDYIDTSIYIEGLSSKARLLIPIRIIRHAGT